MKCNAVSIESIQRLHFARQTEFRVTTSTTRHHTPPTSTKTTPSHTTIARSGYTVSLKPLKTRYSSTTTETKHPLTEKPTTDHATVTIAGFTFAALFFLIIIALIVTIVFYFVPRRGKFLAPNAPNVAVTVQDAEVTLQETNELATNVEEYEDITPEKCISLTGTDVQTKVPVYVNVPVSNVSSDGYMVTQKLNEDNKSHMYTELSN